MSRIMCVLLPVLVLLAIMSMVPAADEPQKPGPTARWRRQTGRLLVDRALVVSHWRCMEEPRFARLAEHLSDEFKAMEYQSRFIVPGSKGKDQQPQDAFERAFLDGLTKDGSNRRPDFTERTIADQYHYYQAVTAKKTCLVACHQAVPDPGQESTSSHGPPEKEGGLIAVVEIVLSNKAIEE